MGNVLREKAQIMDSVAMRRAIARISFEIIERNRGVENLCIIGIMSRGAQLAERIAAKIEEVEGQPIPVGYVDITRFRDDRETRAEGDNTSIQFALTGKKLVLVDDVIFTGRSVRAAIDAIMERGRPDSIQLATLVDRGHRELPIRADYIGKNLPTSKDETVRVLVSERDGEDKVIILEKAE
ncbi:MAG: bifunctional pyr operon transcriptional regulator/uracil phosphoribosyltransferase PyrR [Ruminococcaceae bacterium]|nr:bifunctional pyr operon transcriptional regulator/uracil phosphoribosyltransferase PyrR [Oscillospiraceae bacterium]